MDRGAVRRSGGRGGHRIRNGGSGERLRIREQGRLGQYGLRGLRRGHDGVHHNLRRRIRVPHRRRRRRGDRHHLLRSDGGHRVHHNRGAQGEHRRRHRRLVRFQAHARGRDHSQLEQRADIDHQRGQRHHSGEERDRELGLRLQSGSDRRLGHILRHLLDHRPGHPGKGDPHGIQREQQRNPLEGRPGRQEPDPGRRLRG